MDSEGAVQRETGSMPDGRALRVVPQVALPLADSHGWRPPALAPRAHPRLARRPSAPPERAAIAGKTRVGVSWRALAGFALGSTATALAVTAMESGVFGALLLAMGLACALMVACSIERR